MPCSSLPESRGSPVTRDGYPATAGQLREFVWERRKPTKPSGASCQCEMSHVHPTPRLQGREHRELSAARGHRGWPGGLGTGGRRSPRPQHQTDMAAGERGRTPRCSGAQTAPAEPREHFPAHRRAGGLGRRDCRYGGHKRSRGRGVKPHLCRHCWTQEAYLRPT